MAHARHLGAGWLAVVLTACAGTAAEGKATDWVGDAHAAVRLITGVDDLAGSAVIPAGLEFRFAPGWHGYWRTPGDAGLAPVIDWAGSANLDHATVLWPAPTRLVVEGLQNSVYTGRVVLPVTATRPTPGDPATLHVAVGYAACSNICVPFQADLSLTLPPGSGAPSAEAPLLATALARVPVQPAAAAVTVVGATLIAAPQPQLIVDLRSDGRPFTRPDLFVEGTGSGLPPAPDVALEDGGRAARLTVALPGPLPPGRALTLTLTDGDRVAEWSRSAPVAPALDRPPVAGWLGLLGSALLGGLLLNVMPCVLPVLSIKLIGLTRHAGAPRRAIRLGFVATALGIVTCFLAIAAALSVLKWSGAALGWGIQFQQPWFLAAMAGLTVLFAASFFDWLPIGWPGAGTTTGETPPRGPLIEAFLAGAFATLLATPCSAPFVGTAVGFALAQGPAEIGAIFLCLGLGMASPYMAAAACPGLVRWLPRPGRWMVTVRVILGIGLLLTAIWLLAVLSSTAGPAVAGAAGLLLAVLLGLRAWASRTSAREARRWPGIATAVLAAAPLALALLPAAAPAPMPVDLAWRPFDPDAIPSLVADGRTVLVDVTATWCLTCKVNELAALDRAEIRARLARPDTIRMRADWSRPDAAIAAYLHHFARYGIPLDVVYGPRRPDGEPLPELLTPGLVLDALDRASPAASDPSRAAIVQAP